MIPVLISCAHKTPPPSESRRSTTTTSRLLIPFSQDDGQISPGTIHCCRYRYPILTPTPTATFPPGQGTEPNLWNFVCRRRRRRRPMPPSPRFVFVVMVFVVIIVIVMVMVMVIVIVIVIVIAPTNERYLNGEVAAGIDRVDA